MGIEGPTFDPKIKQFLFAGVDVSAGPADVAHLTGLPLKLQVTRVLVFNATTTPAPAVLHVGDGPAGGSILFCNGAGLNTLTAPSKVINPAVTFTDYSTTGEIWLRCTVGKGTPCTVDVIVEVADLTT